MRMHRYFFVSFIFMVVACVGGLLVAPGSTLVTDATRTPVFLLALIVVLSVFKGGYDFWSNQLRLSVVRTLDERLAVALSTGAIRLLDASAIRDGRLRRIERRQVRDLDGRTALTCAPCDAPPRPLSGHTCLRNAYAAPRGPARGGRANLLGRRASRTALTDGEPRDRVPDIRMAHARASRSRWLASPRTASPGSP